MVTVPAAFPVTVPAVFTAAMFLLLDDHVTLLFFSASGSTTAFNALLALISIDALLGLTVTLLGFTTVTLMLWHMDGLTADFAVMVTVPAFFR